MHWSRLLEAFGVRSTNIEYRRGLGEAICITSDCFKKNYGLRLERL